MKKISLITASAITLLITGCASTQNYSLAVNSWGDGNVKALTRAWGYPKRIKRLPNGNRLYTYHEAHRETDPVVTTPGETTVEHRHGETIVHRTPPTVTGGETHVYKCTTWFEVNRRGRIVNTSFRGNDCTLTNTQMQQLFNPNKPLPGKTA